VAAFIAFWSLSSLLVSYYVYDFTAVTRWEWIPEILSRRPRRWLNIHAGLDQSTGILMRLFPRSDGTVLDIYDPLEMTETSLTRARRKGPQIQAAVPSKLDALPTPDGSRDTLFLLFAAHEIRQTARRVQLFREAKRVLTSAGQLLLVEHLLDWKNLAAFGPGALHFYSYREWLRVAQEAGLMMERDGHITPFVRWFLMRKPAHEIEPGGNIPC
jgi:ubiquinone/menaquinone biosynthesis C-methylase UbiE